MKVCLFDLHLHPFQTKKQDAGMEKWNEPVTCSVLLEHSEPIRFDISNVLRPILT